MIKNKSLPAALILLYTGINTSGKTTFFQSLKADKKLKSINFRDIDEDGVSWVGQGSWKQLV